MELSRFVLICFLAACLVQGVIDAQETQKNGSQSAKDGQKQKSQESNAKTKGQALIQWKELFDGKTLKNWKVTKFGGEGEVEVKNGEIVMDYGSPITGITYTGKPPKINYEVEVQAKPIEGIDFFVGLTMPVKETHISLIVAGWAGAVVGLSNIDDEDASENQTTQFMKFELGKWYHVRARVESDKITCWINNKKVIEQNIKGRKIGIRPEVELSTPLGLSAFETRTAYRKIRIRELVPQKSKPR
ncbi:MAG: DUF1080 domain-containing protein [Planctomycetota bacterium]|nr:DUF1080 domain-containing protein [Planctomycetota bacterium]